MKKARKIKTQGHFLSQVKTVFYKFSETQVNVSRLIIPANLSFKNYCTYSLQGDIL